ncbi:MULTISPECIES: glycosyltransferase [Acinetobacter]|uniref:glycosyltransferase n=1 Tax=Acinetobacter TaxID=469 RepID=UPI001F4B5545|nr:MULTISPECIES: glycosyltransferase [Acinetobacter]MCH7379971.1 glycosyltransferase [Acinetobacter higginsii]
MFNKRVKSVLIILEGLLVGGLETRLKGEVSTLVSKGVKVYFLIIAHDNVLDKSIFNWYNVEDIFILESNNRRSIGFFIDVIDFLNTIIIDKKLELLYVHDAFTALIGTLAARINNINCCMTIHGVMNFHVLSEIEKKIFKDVVIPNLSHINFVSNEVQDTFLPWVDDRKVTNVHSNLINTFRFKKILEKSVDERWLIICRLSKEKLPGILDFLKYAHKAGIKGIVIAGEGGDRTYFENSIVELGLGNFVEFIGQQYDIPKLINHFSGVAGVGRVVLEAIACERPACVLGFFGGVKGLVTPLNFERFQYSNFSGRNLASISNKDFEEQLNVHNNENLYILRKKLEDHFSESKKWPEFIENYITVLKLPTNCIVSSNLIKSLYAQSCYFAPEMSDYFITSDFFINNILFPLLENHASRSDLG